MSKSGGDTNTFQIEYILIAWSSQTLMIYRLIMNPKISQFQKSNKNPLNKAFIGRWRNFFVSYSMFLNVQVLNFCGRILCSLKPLL
jgi:hypothetical protein